MPSVASSLFFKLAASLLPSWQSLGLMATEPTMLSIFSAHLSTPGCPCWESVKVERKILTLPDAVLVNLGKILDKIFVDTTRGCIAATITFILTVLP